MQEKLITFHPVREPLEEYDRIEKRIREVFWDKVYRPVAKLLFLKPTSIKNAKESQLEKAIELGQVSFNGGHFSGEFSAEISRELKSLGAKWDSENKSFYLSPGKISVSFHEKLEASFNRFAQRLKKIDDAIKKILPEKISESVKASDVFRSTISKTDRQLRQSVKKVSVVPVLSEKDQKRLADEWENNLRLFIKDFAAEEIPKFRQMIKQAGLSGTRHKDLLQAIRQSYGVTENKAKFLARQETSLMMTKFKELRYTEAGIQEYRWRCVAGSGNHPVRPSHKILDGKIFSWNDPPITTPSGEPTRRNNPGQDYNCRCFAIPILRKRQT